MRQFIFKLLVLAALILGCQALWGRPIKTPDILTLVDIYCKQKSQVIYFGDSTVTWTLVSDKNQMGISDMLQMVATNDLVLKIARASYSADVFEAILDYVLRKPYRPQTVIVPINLRSFSPEWRLQPLWQFDQLKFVCKFKNSFWMRFSRPLAIFKYFEPRISRHAYEQTKVYYRNQYLGRVKDFDNIEYRNATQERIRKKMTFRYLYQLKENNPKLQALLAIAKRLQQEQIQGVFYLTPLDVQSISQVLGPEFESQRQENVELIKAQLAQYGFSVLDLSNRLPTEYFTWVDERTTAIYPNEHLKQLGRMFVVKTLVDHTPLRERVHQPMN